MTRIPVAVWVVAGLLLGGAVGWWAGSWTACSAGGCKIRVDSIEAAGTWVGGLATAAGLVFTASELRQNRLASTARRELERRDLRIQARQVTVQASPFTKA